MNYLVYLLLGDNPVSRKELIYSLLSLDKIAGLWTKENVEIRIYCDNSFPLSECLIDLKTTIVQLDREKVREIIRQGNDFLLIMKPWIIRDCLNETKGNLLFVDLDTFFIKDPKPLFEQINSGKPVLHLKEHRISIRPVLKAYLEQTRFTLLDGISYSIRPRTEMWNSGVVGVNYHHLPLINEVIHLTCQLSAKKKWHIMEQLSFSCILAKDQQVVDADRYIIHYWFFKPARYLLALHFKMPDEDEIRYCRPFFVNMNIPETISCNSLPRMIIESYKKHGKISEWLFSCLPFHSYIGKLLRRGFLTDPISFSFLLYIEIKQSLHLDIVMDY